MMETSTKNLLLYIAESIMESINCDATGNDQEEIRFLGKRVEAMGRYIQARGTGTGYMKMKRSEFLLLYEKDDDYDGYVFKADEIDVEGGFIPE